MTPIEILEVSKEEAEGAIQREEAFSVGISPTLQQEGVLLWPLSSRTNIVRMSTLKSVEMFEKVSAF